MPSDVQAAAVRCYRLWSIDPRHPCLRFRRLQGSPDRFTVRIGDHHKLIAAHQDLAARIAELERGQQHTVSVIEVLVDDIGRLSGEVKRMKALPEPRRRRIGFPAGGTGVEPR